MVRGVRFTPAQLFAQSTAHYVYTVERKVCVPFGIICIKWSKKIQIFISVAEKKLYVMFLLSTKCKHSQGRVEKVYEPLDGLYKNHTLLLLFLGLLPDVAHTCTMQLSEDRRSKVVNSYEAGKLCPTALIFMSLIDRQTEFKWKVQHCCYCVV